MEKPRPQCLFPHLEQRAQPEPQELQRAGGLRPIDGRAKASSEGTEPPRRSRLSRSQPSLRPAQSVLSAVSTSFVPSLPPEQLKLTEEATADKPVEETKTRAKSKVKRSQSQVSDAPQPPSLSRRRPTPGETAVAFLPYAASEVSSLQSGWRQDYWTEPSPLFTQGLLSQDVRYATECSPCKCVIKEAALPPSGDRQNAQELQQQQRLRWLDSLIKQEEEGLPFQRHSMSKVNARVFPEKLLNQHPWSHKWLPGRDCAQLQPLVKAKERAAAA